MGLKVLSIVGCSLVGLAAADESWVNKLGVGAQAGTTGFGGMLTYDVTDWVYFKAEFNTLTYTESDLEIDGTTYDGELDFMNAGLSVNVRPLHMLPIVDGLKVVAGVYKVNNTVHIEASREGDMVEIAGTPYMLDADDRIIGDAEFDSIAPYLGLGWDWSFGMDDTFTFSLEAGALITGAPDVEFSVSGNEVGGSVITSEQIAAETAEFEDEVDQISVLPVVKVGALLRF